MRLLVTTLLLFSLNATAGEVTEFKPRPAAVEEGSDTYVGILLSEEDFRKLLQDKIDTNAKVAQCDVDKGSALNFKSSTNYPSKIFRKQSKKTILGLEETRAPLDY